MVLKMLDKAGAQVDFSSEQYASPKILSRKLIRYLKLPDDGYDKRHDCPVPNPDGKFYPLINTGASKYLDPETNKYRATTLTDGRMGAVM